MALFMVKNSNIRLLKDKMNLAFSNYKVSVPISKYQPRHTYIHYGSKLLFEMATFRIIADPMVFWQENSLDHAGKLRSDCFTKWSDIFFKVLKESGK